MRKLVAQEFVSLDGVMEAPEKWQLTNELFGDDAAAFCLTAYQEAGALLLGRVTYQEFAGFWPNQSDDDPFAKWINELPKYVVSRALKTLDWHGTQPIREDVDGSVRKLKDQPGGPILIAGSARLVDSLTEAGLIDEYQVLVHRFSSGEASACSREASIPRSSRSLRPRRFPPASLPSPIERRARRCSDDCRRVAPLTYQRPPDRPAGFRL
jgi:dihydrofolate reductase